MDRHPADAHFEQFCRTGDPRALAAVFDLLAPELLLAAAHFARGGPDAEDLVQATFLAAIESAARWDPSRALLPWLVGILVNQARRERRRLRRPPNLPVPPFGNDDPGLAAEANELAEKLSAALRDLPQPYRHVLTLRWVHGLMPLQIAHSLGCSPETVKTQLRRGLKALRQSLPSGIALSTLAVLLAPERGLAAVRDAVLQRAGAPAPVAAAAATEVARAARPAMNPSLVGLGLLATVAGTVLTWRALRDPATPAAPALAAARAPAHPSEAPSPDASPSAPRIALPGDALGPGEAALAIRVWHSTDEAPARAARVRLLPLGVNDPDLREVVVVLDEAGCAAPRVTPGRWRLVADRGGEVTVDVAGGKTTRAEVAIQRGVDVEGTVVGPGAGTTGAPLGRARIWLSKPGVFDDGIEVAVAGADGRFALRDVERGRCLSALADGLATSPFVLVDGEAGAAQNVVLRLEHPGLALSGTVRDADDRPVAGASVLVGANFSTARSPGGHDGNLRAPPVWLRTDAEGRFATSSIEPFSSVQQVWVGAPGLATWSEKVTLDPKAAATVQVRLGPGARLRGRVRDGEGRPLQGVRIEASYWLTDSARFVPLGPSWRRVVGFSATDGTFALAGLRPGRNRLHAATDDGRRAVLAPELHEFEEFTWDAVLAAPVELHGRLATDDGAPLAGWRIELEEPHGRGSLPAVTTGEDGRFTVADCDRGRHVLRARARNFAFRGPQLWQLVTPGGEEVLVTVPRRELPEARVVGTVVDGDGRPVAANVALQDPRFGQAATACRADGTFTLGPVLPVRGSLFVLRDAIALLRVDDVQITAPGDHDAGTLRIPATGQLRVRVRDRQGAPQMRGTITIHDDRERWFGSLLLERARAGLELAAGSYTLTTADGVALSLHAFTIRAGAETLVEVEAQPAVKRPLTFAHPYDGTDLRLDWRWYDGQGRLVAHVPSGWTRGATDELGTDSEWLAPGRYRLEVESSRGLRATADVHIDDLAPNDIPIHLEFR